MSKGVRYIGMGVDAAGATLGYMGVVCVGRVRRHGTSRSGEPKLEVCLDNDYVTTPMIKEAAERGAIVYAEVLVDNERYPVFTKPYLDRGMLCMVLHKKFNYVWERLWLENKPVLIIFRLRW